MSQTWGRLCCVRGFPSFTRRSGSLPLRLACAPSAIIGRGDVCIEAVARAVVLEAQGMFLVCAVVIGASK